MDVYVGIPWGSYQDRVLLERIGQADASAHALKVMEQCQLLSNMASEFGDAYRGFVHLQQRDYAAAAHCDCGTVLMDGVVISVKNARSHLERSSWSFDSDLELKIPMFQDHTLIREVKTRELVGKYVDMREQNDRVCVCHPHFPHGIGRYMGESSLNSTFLFHVDGS